MLPSINKSSDLLQSVFRFLGSWRVPAVPSYLLLLPKTTIWLSIHFAPGATSRSSGKTELLRSNGADQVFVDGGSIADQVKETGLYEKVMCV